LKLKRAKARHPELDSGSAGGFRKNIKNKSCALKANNNKQKKE
jgi:hypothetical protein